MVFRGKVSPNKALYRLAQADLGVDKAASGSPVEGMGALVKSFAASVWQLTRPFYLIIRYGFDLNQTVPSTAALPLAGVLHAACHHVRG